MSIIPLNLTECHSTVGLKAESRKADCADALARSEGLTARRVAPLKVEKKKQITHVKHTDSCHLKVERAK